MIKFFCLTTLRVVKLTSAQLNLQALQQKLYVIMKIQQLKFYVTMEIQQKKLYITM
jgi:hypothetical protein